MQVNAKELNKEISPQQVSEVPNTFIVSEIVSRLYEHYLDYAIEDPAETRKLCSFLRGIEESDMLALRINSPGGRFDLAAQIVNAIRECKGRVVGVIEQECASAATLIFLSCDSWEVNPWAEMMIHNATYGAWGKAHEISARVRASDDRMAKVLKEVYSGFLTDSEIEDVIKGQDIYLTSDEISDRLQKMVDMEKEDASAEQEADQCTQVSSCGEE